MVAPVPQQMKNFRPGNRADEHDIPSARLYSNKLFLVNQKENACQNVRSLCETDLVCVTVCVTFLLQIRNLRARGQRFLDIPDKYYENLKARLKLSNVKVKEDIDVVRNISVDFL